ncbi:hypothetical protein [Dactylosporangium sp. CA-139066]|uniref:hypothetical protein n=1 Tax=Dactylosporangium sp. CA-139066 TaxID=3239930 RepID=UPI003D8DE93D
MKLSCLVVVAGALLAGCASPTVAGPPATTYAPADLVLQVRIFGGFVPVSVTVTQMPEISVYGDGRVITNGPTPAIYPGPALPNVQVTRIAQADVSALTRRALDAGVGNGEDAGTPSVADAPATRITVRTDAGLVSTDVMALGLEDATLSRDQRAVRKRMQDLVADLRDLRKTLGKDHIDEPAPYEPARLAAVAGEWQPSDTGQPSDPPALPWPGSADLPGPAVPNRPGVNCLVVDAPGVLAAARQANARTPWLSGDARWSVQFRLLLPDETSCADLAR